VIGFHDCLPLFRQAGNDHSVIRQHGLCFWLRRAVEKCGYDRWWPAEEVASSKICCLRTTYPINLTDR